jgi:hypothetical protein
MTGMTGSPLSTVRARVYARACARGRDGDKGPTRHTRHADKAGPPGGQKPEQVVRWRAQCYKM